MNWIRHQAAALLVLFLLLLLAVAARTAPHYANIFPGSDDVRLLGTDAYYHLRHTQFAAENFPSVMRADVGSHYPTGLRDDAAGLFNVGLAAVALGASGGQSVDQWIPVVLAWSPVVFFVLASLALFWLASSLAGRPAGLLCCTLYFLFPGEALERTTLGFGDYHALELLLVISTIIGLLRCIERSRASPGSEPPWWRPDFVSVLPLVLFLFSWRGAMLYVPIVAFSFFVVGLHDLRHGTSWKAAATAAFRYGAGGFVLAGGAALLFPSMVIAPRFFPLSIAANGVLLGLLVTMLAPAASLSLLSTFVSSRWKPDPALVALALFVATSIVALGSVLLMVSPPDKTVVSEAHPTSLWLAWHLMGPTAFLAIAAVPSILIASWRCSKNWRALVPLVFGGAIVLLWVRTNDFGYLVPQFAALMTTLLVVDAARVLQPRLKPWQRWLACVVCAITATSLIWPLEWVRRPWYVHKPAMMVIHEGWIESMRWLREATPRPSVLPTTEIAGWNGGDYPYPSNAYGVLSAWDAGNFISAIGKRIPMSSRFPMQRTAALLYDPSRPESGDELCTSCEPGEAVRYVVIDARTVSQLYRPMAGMLGLHVELNVERVWDYEGKKIDRAVFGADYRRSLAARLYLDDGERLGRYRLVYESPSEHVLAYRSNEYGVARTSVHMSSPTQRSNAVRWIEEGSVFPSPLGLMYDPVLVPSVKIFEYVVGARVIGSAPAGSNVEARLDLRIETTGRSFVYIQSTRADERGRFELVLPYPTGHPPSSSVVESDGPYRLRAFSSAGPVGDVYPLDVSEAQVSVGEQIDLSSVAKSTSQAKP